MTSPPVDLRPLLGNSAESLADQPLTLCDAAIDRAADFLFEANSWREVLGAGRQLMALREQWSKGLPAGSVLLRAEPDRTVALVPPQNEARWTAVWSDMVTEATGGTMALNIGTVPITGKQVFNGLYRAPTRVIGIPGMTDHQSRINQYYGVDNPSTLPAAERISGRRNFGEVLNLALTNRQRSADDRLQVAFHECLPLCVRCTICDVRPAELGTTTNSAPPMCAICAAKHRRAANERFGTGNYALIEAVAPGAERLLLGQNKPADFQRLATALDDSWRRAIAEAQKAGAVIALWQTSATAWLIAPAAVALNAVARLCSAFETANGYPGLGKPIVAASIIFADNRVHRPKTLADLAQTVLTGVISGALRDLEIASGAIRLASVEAAGSNAGLQGDLIRYTPETLGRLDSAAQKFVASGFPVGLLNTLPIQGASQVASLAFEQIRSRLTAPQRQQLDEVTREFERLWGVGTTRFFQAMGDAQLVQDRIRPDSPAASRNVP